MQVSLNLQNRHYAPVNKTYSTAKTTVNTNNYQTFRPQLITFKGKNKTDILVYAAESAKVANKGGVGTVAADFGMQAVFDNKKYRTALFMPYYNGEVIYSADAKHSAFLPDKPIQGKYLRTDVRYKDGKPIFVKGSMVGKTVADLGPKDYKLLEEVASKEIDAPTGKEVAKIFRILNDKDNPHTFLVFTQGTGAMREPYGNGTSYSSGAKPLRNLDPYAVNNYALAEMLPDLEAKGILKPAGVVLNDPHTAYLIEFMAKKAEEGSKFYQNARASYVVHNPGAGYQQKTSLQNMFSNLATNQEIDMVASSPIYKEVEKQGFQEEFFKRLLPNLVDEKGQTSPLWLALKHRENGSLDYCGTVSPGAAESYAKGAGNATGVKGLLGRLYDQGKFVGILNGLNSPGIDPRKIADLDYYKEEKEVKTASGKKVTLEPFKTFDPTDSNTSLDDIIKIKQANAVNLFERINLAENNPEFVIGMKRPNTAVRGSIDTKLIRQIKANLEKGDKFNFNKHVKLYVSWGRADEQKGLDVAINAFRKYMHQAELEGGKAWKTAQNSVLILGGDVQSSYLKDYMYSVIDNALKDPLLKGRFAFLDGFAPNAVLSNPATFPIFPSRFAPCELTDQEARTYGGLPVVTGIEGLDDKNFDLNEKFDEKLNAALAKEKESIEKTLLAKEEAKIKKDPKFKKATEEQIKKELELRRKNGIAEQVENELEAKRPAIIEEIKKENLKSFTGAKTKSSALTDILAIDFNQDPVYSKFPDAEKDKIKKAIKAYKDLLAKTKKDLTAEYSSQIFEHADGKQYRLTAEDVAKKVQEAIEKQIRDKGELYTLYQRAQDELVSQELAVKMRDMGLMDIETLKKGMDNNFKMKKGWSDNAALQRIRDKNGRQLSASEAYEKGLFGSKAQKKKRLFEFTEAKLHEVEDYFKTILKDKLGINFDQPSGTTPTSTGGSSGNKNPNGLLGGNNKAPKPPASGSWFDNIFNKQTGAIIIGLAALGGLAYYVFKPEENPNRAKGTQKNTQTYTA